MSVDRNRYPQLAPDELPRKPKRVGVIVLPGFPAMAFAALVEPLRAANGMAGRLLYDLKVIGCEAVVPSSGVLSARPDLVAPGLPDMDRVILLSGGDAATVDLGALLPWLRKLDRLGTEIGAAADGAFALARAGLLEGRRCATHWTARAAFAARFPDIPLEPNLWVIERRRLTCAGGTAALDMTLELIARDAGGAIADAVADWFSHARRQGAGALGPPPAVATLPEGPLRVAVAALEQQIESGFDVEELEARSGIGRDALERRFNATLGMGPAAYLRRMRLNRAAELLQSTELQIAQIALACGYADAAAFSRAFRAKTGSTPSDLRRTAH
ncbi:GlxA family transcriptional regulator [uncultured Roseobacter sp.]|uniref:GlxA family transcriptional regulator n=1 Tax=uncultured Roseobacter sp. TaxID=114847 RepID=UPI002621C195|nr:helix-turn-helix domain-containing protein [uncultured Roseobacter sp.]